MGVVIVLLWLPCRSALTKKRKQAIEESKYLGGDIEHTHLVKGLDYALLQKVCVEWVWLVGVVRGCGL